MPAVKLDISEEGLWALHGSKLEGSYNLNEVLDERKFMIEHQPIESFTNRFSRIKPNDYLQLKGSGTSIAEQKGKTLMDNFRDICDEIVSGYAQGNRIRYMEDTTSEDGFVKITKEEELSILLDEFSAFVKNRFGKQHQEDAIRVAEQTNDIQKIRQELGVGTKEYYEPLQIPVGFAEKLVEDARQYIEYNK